MSNAPQVPTPTPSPLSEALRQELSALRGSWIGFLILGILTMLLGTLLIVTPWLGTLATVWMISLLMIVSGIGQFVGAFWVRRWGGFFLSLLSGVLYVAVGVLIFDRPVAAAEGLTLVIAVFLVVGGVFRIAGASSQRFHGWGWMVLNGAIALVLGVMIWRQFPGSSLWVIGLFVGIEMLFNGWTWIFLALGLRRLPKAEAPSAS